MIPKPTGEAVVSPGLQPAGTVHWIRTVKLAPGGWGHDSHLPLAGHRIERRYCATMQGLRRGTFSAYSKIGCETRAFRALGCAERVKS